MCDLNIESITNIMKNFPNYWCLFNIYDIFGSKNECKEDGPCLEEMKLVDKNAWRYHTTKPLFKVLIIRTQFGWIKLKSSKARWICYEYLFIVISFGLRFMEVLVV